MKEPILTIAIPTYNRAGNLKRLLESIGKIDTDIIEILVSDNSSNNDVRILVEQAYPYVKYIKNTSNIGPDRNFLQCYNLATGQYVWLVGDDDLIIKKGLIELLSFINLNNSLTLVFVNHNSYITNKNKIIIGKNFLHFKKKCKIVDDKNDFVRIAQYQLTFMSSFLINRDKFKSVANPEKYIGTYFIHSSIAFEASKEINLKFGIVYFPCISQGMDNDIKRKDEYEKYEFIYKTFTERQKKLFCDVATHFGFDKYLMRKVHINFVLQIFRFKLLIATKESVDPRVKTLFYKYLMPYSMTSFKCILFIILPYLLLPTVVLRYIRKFYHYIVDMENKELVYEKIS